MNLGTYLIGLFVVCGIATATAEPAGPPAKQVIRSIRSSPRHSWTARSPSSNTSKRRRTTTVPACVASSGYAARTPSLCSIRSRRIMQRDFASPTISNGSFACKKPARASRRSFCTNLRSARLRSRDQKAARRSCLGIPEESARVAKGREGPRVSHYGESVEGD